jgi:hypothetical protein
MGMMVVAVGSHCSIPPYINYQGILTDDTGMPLDGLHDLTFKIYNDSTGGVALWTEVHPDVEVDDGLFNVILGKTTSFLDSLGVDDDPWMAIQVDTDPEIIPRMELTSVPYAFTAREAGIADTVDWYHITSMPAGFADGVDDVGGGGGWVDDGTFVRLESASDWVGIGTSTPAAKLDVRGNLYVSTPGVGCNVMFHGWDADGSGLWWLGSPLSLVTGRDTDGTHWSTVGNYSISAGYNNKVEGSSAACFGSWNSTPGAQTLATGYRSTANGMRSVALGSYATTNGEASFALGYSVAAMADFSLVMGSGLGGADTLKNSTPNSFLVGFGGDPMLFVGGPDDRVGIGTTTPGQALDVVGTAEVDGFKMPTGASNGYVLTSDASGVGTWQATSAVSDGDWTLSGTNQYSAVAGNVGVGTTTPAHKLDVDGSINISSGSTYRIDGWRVLSSGYSNTIVGFGAGFNTTGTGQTFVGSFAGGSSPSGSNNTFLGHWAGTSNTTGVDNTFVGFNAGSDNDEGFWNTFLGFGAGSDNTTADYNTFLGMNAGRYNTTGYSNTFVGTQTGISNTEGWQNTFVGRSAGYNNLTGSGNIFIGYQAGYNETGSNKLYIDNSLTSTPLVHGQFDSDIVTINGNLGISTASPGEDLHVVGNVRVDGEYWGDRASSYNDMILNTNDDVLVYMESIGSGAAANFQIYAQSYGTPVEVMRVEEDGDLWVLKDLMADGLKPAVVPAAEHGRRRLYAVESPEVWFEDFGSGQLIDGSAVVNLESIFAATVNTDEDYHVFLTPVDGWASLYVTNMTPTSFEVRDADGKSDIAFRYRIVAKRNGYENVRLELEDRMAEEG